MAWQTKIKIATWSLVIMFLLLMIPFDKIFKNIQKNSKLQITANEKAAEILAETKTMINSAIKNGQKSEYEFLTYATDLKILRDQQQKLEMLSDDYVTEKMTLSKQINATIEGNLDKLRAIKLDNFSFHSKLNQAFDQVGLIKGLPDGTITAALLTIIKWYFIFAIFVFFIFCCRLYYSPNLSLKEELILGLPRMLLFSLFWPFSLETYPHKEKTAKENRVQKALNRFANKMNFNWRQREKFREQITEEICAPIRKVNRAIEKVENLPQTAKEKGRWATVFTSLLATLLSPIVTRADELMQFILTGSGSGNNLVFKYNHNEPNWQTNCSFTDQGGNIQMLAGPKFILWKMIVKPEVGAIITTQDKLKIDNGLIGLNAIMPATPDWHWNAWTLNKYVINFKDKLSHKFTWDNALHYMLTKLGLQSLGLGFGTNGMYLPFADDNRITGNFGPRLFWKASKSISIETALGFDFKSLAPAMFRLLAFVPF